MAYSLKQITCSEKACIYSLIVDNYNFLEEVKGHYPKDHGKLLRYCERFAEIGQIYDDTKFKQLQGDIYEFKTDKLRFLCLQLPGKRPRTLIINHYHKKQKKRSPAKDLDKSIRISNKIIELYNSGEIEFGEQNEN